MADAPAETPPTTVLVELLASAGEFDAGVEVLDAHPGPLPAAMTLRATLFLCEPRDLSTARSVLSVVKPAHIDALARCGALGAYEAVLRVLARAFPESPEWAQRNAKITVLRSPWPEVTEDPQLAQVGVLVSQGALQEALQALQALPRSPRVQPRLDALRGVLREPVVTRPYAHAEAPGAEPRASEPNSPPRPSVPSVLVQLRANLDAGDLGGALRQFGLLMRAQPTEVRWLRARDALARLVQSPTEDGGEDLEVTQQVGAVAEVDLWVRQGDLSKARARARALLELARDAAARELARRLADLDTILGALHHSGSDAPERENAPTLEEPMHLEPSEAPLAEPVDASTEEATAPRRPSLLEPPEELPGEVVQSPLEPALLEPSAPPVEPPAPVAPTPSAAPPVATPPTAPPEAQGPTGLQVKRRIVRLK